MSYNYAEQRPSVFTENGQKLFLAIRDQTQRLLKESGAVTSGKLINGMTGDTWRMLACIDRLVELNEIKEVQNPYSQAGQHRIFVDARRE